MGRSAELGKRCGFLMHKSVVKQNERLQDDARLNLTDPYLRIGSIVSDRYGYRF